MLRIQKTIAILMSFLLVLGTFPVGAVAQNASPAATQEENATLSAEELDGIVAPIALYPDALVAQILGASTFPYEIVDATLWLKDNSQLKGEALAKAVDQQSWDPAVKALTQFPSVLDNMAKNLAWTSSLGEASATQQPDVMAAVQRMRAKAQAAGNLKSSPEIKVVQESPQTIVIQPANPQVVYVPVYNPAVVYGVPYAYPGYVYVVPPPPTAVMVFGVGIMVGAMVYGGCCAVSDVNVAIVDDGGAMPVGAPITPAPPVRNGEFPSNSHIRCDPLHAVISDSSAVAVAFLDLFYSSPQPRKCPLRSIVAVIKNSAG